MKYVIIFALMLLCVSGCSITNCQEDFGCFKKHIKNCTRSRTNFNYDNGSVRLTIRGEKSNDCMISLKIDNISREMKSKYPQESTILLGKTINCRIEKKQLYNESVLLISDILNMSEEMNKSCSGPIKDLMNGPLRNIITQELKKGFDE